MTVMVVIEPDEQRLQALIKFIGTHEPTFQIKAANYDHLYSLHRDSVFQPDLVVLCVHSCEDVFELTHASQVVYEPKHMLLHSTTLSIPQALPRLGSILDGYVHGDASYNQLLASIRMVLAGGECFPLLLPSPSDTAYTQLSLPLLATRPLEFKTRLKAPQPPPPAQDTEGMAEHEAKMLGITARQYEVLVRLARGHPIKTISRDLNISISTVKAHRETLYQRLDVNNRSQAVYVAFARGATLGQRVAGQPRVET